MENKYEQVKYLMIDKKLIFRLENLLGRDNIEIDAPMSRYTSFRIGGPADVMIFPKSEDEIVGAISVIKEYEVDYMIMGNGSNLLVLDGGVRGVVINLFKNFSNIEVSGNSIKVAAGVLLSMLGNTAQKNGLGGLEFAAGIPGTVGGAVMMNAGAYGGEIKDVLVSATVLDGDCKMEVTSGELNFDYRHSAVTDNDWIVLSAKFRLENKDMAVIRARMDELAFARKSKQPLSKPSAGSAFKRPIGGYASKLIDDAGLKGLSVGGAQVSTKHAGFIINTGDASACDVLSLIELVKEKVLEYSGIQMEPEVHIVGEEI